MKRREFLRLLGLGLAAGWAGGIFSGHWPLTTGHFPMPLAGYEKELRLALLADAHLKGGDEKSPEARFLARAVAEIRALKPAPDLILFAGDLAHAADPRALDLGREILADLPVPPLMVRGEGDGDSEPWLRRFGAPWFSHSLRGINLVGLNSHPVSAPQGPAFAIGLEQQLRLAAALARLDPAAPLIILSHAPLAQIFRPWRQWTMDAPAVAALLAPFSSIICLHGHVHREVVSIQWSVASQIPPRPPLEKGGEGKLRRLEENAFPGKSGGPLSPPLTKGDLGGFYRAGPGEESLSGRIMGQGLPSTAWPLPSPCQGTPAAARPGLGPHGCGWSLLSLRTDGPDFRSRIWA